jgi:pyruvate formate lyase activating enzyme
MAKTSNRKGQNGIIFNIQRYSIHDGPGIRTTVFLKGCPLSCFWCQNPESQAARPEILFDRNSCAACGQCIVACSSGANWLQDDYARIDRGKCTGCGACVESCPTKARKLTGRYATVDEIMEEVLRDRKFYENSGGGITLSGGEPTWQTKFALQLLRRCKEEGLHTTLDTCGYVPWPSMQKLLEYSDIVLYDIKCLDATKHSKATGKPNNLILSNAQKIASHKEIWIRIPLVPGFNDSPEEVATIVRFAKRELGAVRIDLHPYNKLGESKYGRLDKAAVSLEPQTEDHLKRLQAIVISA